MTLRNIFFLLITTLLCLGPAKAQSLFEGNIAHDFIAEDINGETYRLYDILSQGKSVILSFSTTWCGPCWEYHNSKALRDFYFRYGPQGADESMVFFIESDESTGLDQLKGQGQRTWGDWTKGTPYPIIDNALIQNYYGVKAWPTILLVCPNREVTNIGRLTPNQIYDYTAECGISNTKPEIVFSANKRSLCSLETIKFINQSFPIPTEYYWEFGDGQYSTEENPEHLYSDPGNYTVKLTARNHVGESVHEKVDFIEIGNGKTNALRTVGPTEHGIGPTRLHRRANQGLIFDAINDFILESVQINSWIDANRVITVWNDEGHVTCRREIPVHIGKQRVELDFYIPKGNNYRIGLESSGYLSRYVKDRWNPKDVGYPFILDDLVSIHRSTESEDPFDYYYFFYEWRVREPGCDFTLISPNATVEKLTYSPNPTADRILIKTSAQTSPKVFNDQGQLVNVPLKKTSFGWEADLSTQSKGLYFLEVEGSIGKVIKH